GFTGPYVLPEDIEQRTDHLVHVVAGSGSVPNFAILKDSLKTGSKLRHTFDYPNKTRNAICFQQTLCQLKNQHPDRLKVVHALTRETDPAVFGTKVRRGRVSFELLKEHIPDPGSCIAYICGPAINPWDRKMAAERGEVPKPRFLETAIEHLRQ